MGFSKYAMSAGAALFRGLSISAQDEGQGGLRRPTILRVEYT